jgi:protein-L-isoaspartate(D-aspartate) O-methyltransferase
MGKTLSRLAAIGTCLASLGLLALGAAPATAQDPFEEPRRLMVDEQLRRRGISQTELLQAMQTVPRHLFVPEQVRPEAYVDEPLPFGRDGEALLQPYMTALMIELLELDGTQKVLEVGTGSGYDAAVLSKLAREVYTIEIDRRRGEAAEERLAKLGYDNVHVRIGDGNEGWPDQAPFDAIILTAAPEEPPPKLLAQLKMDGRMVVAVGKGDFQELTVIRKGRDGVLQKRRIDPVIFPRMSRERE